ncbi:hypothetical protein GRI62_12755 [Erythrobacter arachoides]|uniref:Acid phosphatase n=1 Tax=Aurantiacibacter arachoides TaxID=1850444 RepID=A0A845A6B6_9SPHN|nr:hypothetical protein [Aurantiacibacter arachoides]MXO94467.1 hypothetical protein [Aurantiacibacter arachoides]GGD63215.1 hypothetical protein GCM10011411_24400 [Aurantiacibacter arachoides]
MRKTPILAAMAIALALQGCVALAIVPIAASGGLLARSALTGDRTREAITVGTDIDPETVDFASYAAFTVLDTSELPAPAATIPDDGPLGAFHAFAARALPDADPDAAARPAERYSALLQNPSALRPSLAACQQEVPAVLLDLDPAGGLMPTAMGAAPNPALVAVLDDLRRRNVAIAWMTDREPTEAGRIRELLLSTGLDPTGRDPLFVQRYPGETKQARRRALLETHCPIAIAGDERTDFDDLYAFLLDQSAAGPLEAMLGSGWFLIPAPLD